MSSRSPSTSDQLPKAQLGLLACAFIVVSFILGGGSRLDLFGPALHRLIAIAIMAWLISRPSFSFRAAPRGETYFLAAMLALPLIQLIPLPPFLWQSFGGREIVIEADMLLGVAHWRPLSLTPERTANAFFAMLVPLCACLIGLHLDRRGLRWTLTGIVVIALLSALLGLGQMIVGSGSPLYLYAVTNSDAAVGLFSNANHHGLFLACALPCLFFLAQNDLRSSGTMRIELWLLMLAVLAILAGANVMTFSRAGVGLFVLSLALSLASTDMGKEMLSRRTWMLCMGVGLSVLLLLWISLFLVTSIGTRFLEGVAEDGRIGNVWEFARIAAHYFPWGSGLGSFQQVFLVFESVETMSLTYLNQAHNEPAQVLIEAGLAGIVLGALFLQWWARKGWAAWRPAPLSTGGKLTVARLATLILALCIVHSLFDYPLRTGAMAALAGLCAGLLMNSQISERRISNRSV